MKMTVVSVKQEAAIGDGSDAMILRYGRETYKNSHGRETCWRFCPGRN